MNHTTTAIWKAIMFLQDWDKFLTASFNSTCMSSLINYIMHAQSVGSDSFHHPLDSRAENAKARKNPAAWIC